ncbi:MAG TPA: response regulator [Candidatus Deferrimicrobium sp.]|nr:response regulator [Candidatus Deferrimicrobium sp.]
MKTPSILVVDDELLIRDLLYDFFLGQGWDIAVAENGERALQILRSRQIDLVLTDIKMPLMDGLELTSQMKESYPGIPVVLMTGYPSVESAITALRYKVEDYITKPFNINQLYKLVDAKIREREVR